VSAVTSDRAIETRDATPFDAVPVWIAAIAGAIAGVGAALLPDGGTGAVVLAPFVIAAAVDARTRRIPNALSAATLALALTAALAGGEAASSALGASAALVAGVALYAGARGAFGMGDVKLMTGAGAAVGLAHVLDFIVAMAFGGGMLALACLAWHRDARATMPYGPAIAVGVAGVFWLAR